MSQPFSYEMWHIWGNTMATKQKPTTTWVAGYIMETAGFEPASRGPDTNLSTCVVY